MATDKILAIIFSFGGIIFTFWYFLAKKEEVVEVTGENIDITVKGGYKPSEVAIPKGKKTTLNFTRTDENSCLEEVVIPDFKIKKYLPMNEQVSVDLKPEKSGKYDISCGMGMFHGKLIVK